MVARAKTEADFFRRQILHRPKALDKFRQQRRASGRDQFVRFIALRHTDAPRPQDGQRCRRRNRETSVGAIDPAGAFDDRRRQDLRLADHFQRDTRANDVHNRIHRADFVKMNLPRRTTVDFSFRVGDALKNRDGLFFHPWGQLATTDELFDFGKCPVLIVMMVTMRVVVFMTLMMMLMAMIMVMSMMVVMGAGQVDIQFHSLDTRLLLAGNMQMPAVEFQLLQFAFQFMGIDTEVQQCANEHVATDAAENVEVKCFHDVEAKTLIWLAANPAPNPLSMFTTVNPLAQLFNMPNRAATPPKLAP